MANPEHLEILKRGSEAWNRWKAGNPQIQPDLTEASLRGARLSHIDLSLADLSKADLRGAVLVKANLVGARFRRANLNSAYLRVADLRRADFSRADLTETDVSQSNLSQAKLIGADLSRANLTGTKLVGANLSGARLIRANLYYADLSRAELMRTDASGVYLNHANLSGTYLRGADLCYAKLNGADLESALLGSTILGDTDLSGTKGLETCIHSGPSIIDHQTLAKSGGLPLNFLRGCGLPDRVSDYLSSLLSDPIQFYSCFISYSSIDQEFANTLYAGLQNKGVRCWFAPHDLPIGARIRPAIDESIRVHDKLLLVLSEASVSSQWVQQEVEMALARERELEGKIVLFPIRIDDAVMEVKSGWPALLRNTRNVGDFTRWKEHDSYREAFDRLLRDLRAGAGRPAGGAPPSPAGT